jgi:hypothetical protein
VCSDSTTHHAHFTELQALRGSLTELRRELALRDEQTMISLVQLATDANLRALTQQLEDLRTELHQKLDEQMIRLRSEMRQLCGRTMPTDTEKENRKQSSELRVPGKRAELQETQYDELPSGLRETETILQRTTSSDSSS